METKGPVGGLESYPPILTVEQASQLLQVKQRTIYDWSSRKLLKGCSFRAGKHLRFFRDKLVAHVAQGGINGRDE
jgi:excisionase family DNA binding protein